jgi:hypothetical protein
MGQGQIGVGRLGDLQGAAIEHQPGPAAAELGGAGCLELLGEGLEAAEVGGDLVGQGTGGGAATTGLDFDRGRGGRFLRFSYCGREADMAAAPERLARWLGR